MPIFESDVNSLCTINFIDTEGQIPMVSSREVAAKFGKRHADVLRAIEEIKSHTEHETFSQRNFASAEYIDEQGKTRKEINLTKNVPPQRMQSAAFLLSHFGVFKLI
jgi:phage regulator Rha-like protein